MNNIEKTKTILKKLEACFKTLNDTCQGFKDKLQPFGENIKVKNPFYNY